jgi:hypothetical protein
MAAEDVLNTDESLYRLEWVRPLFPPSLDPFTLLTLSSRADPNRTSPHDPTPRQGRPHPRRQRPDAARLEETAPDVVGFVCVDERDGERRGAGVGAVVEAVRPSFLCFFVRLFRAEELTMFTSRNRLVSAAEDPQDFDLATGLEAKVFEGGYQLFFSANTECVPFSPCLSSICADGAPHTGTTFTAVARNQSRWSMFERDGKRGLRSG